MVISWDTLHMWGPKILFLQTFWICIDQPPKQHETERAVTKTNAIVKSAENTSFCNYSSFLFYFISFTKYKSFFFFSTKLSCSFSLVMSRVTVILIFSYTADIDFILFLTSKIPTIAIFETILVSANKRLILNRTICVRIFGTF